MRSLWLIQTPIILDKNNRRKTVIVYIYLSLNVIFILRQNHDILLLLYLMTLFSYAVFKKFPCFVTGNSLYYVFENLVL